MNEETELLMRRRQLFKQGFPYRPSYFETVYSRRRQLQPQITCKPPDYSFLLEPRAQSFDNKFLSILGFFEVSVKRI